MIDRSRFESIYRETSSKVTRYVGSLIGWCSQVEDITQEAYLFQASSRLEE